MKRTDWYEYNIPTWVIPYLYDADCQHWDDEQLDRIDAWLNDNVPGWHSEPIEIVELSSQWFCCRPDWYPQLSATVQTLRFIRVWDDGIQYNRFDILAAYSHFVLRHHRVLESSYSSKIARQLLRIKFKPGLSDSRLHSISKNAKMIYMELVRKHYNN